MVTQTETARKTLCFACGEIILLGHEVLRWRNVDGDFWLVAIHKECEWS